MHPFVKLTGWRTPRRHPEPCKRGKYGRAYILSCFLRSPPILKGGIIKSLPFKGETTYYILRVASAPSSLLSLTHWIFRSLMLPYKSSSHSAKCVRCASLRSGGRRLAVRTAMEHPIGALPRTPFPASRDFPSRGNEKIGGTGYCVTYDTDSQSRNAGFILIAP